jgi:hypothetical protein
MDNVQNVDPSGNGSYKMSTLSKRLTRNTRRLLNMGRHNVGRRPMLC